jgi:hypothetical protein
VNAILRILIVLVGSLFFAGCHLSSTERSWSNHPRLTLTAGEDVLSGTYALELKGYRSTPEGLHLELKEKHYSSGSFKRFVHFSELAHQERDRANDQFRLIGDGGTIHFTGTRVGGEGNGTYRFEPDTIFQAEAAKLIGEVTTRDLMDMVLAEVTIEYIRGVRETGLRANAKEVLRLKRHGLGIDEVKEFAGQGFQADDMVRLRNNGVKPDFSREVINSGLTRNSEEIAKLRNHGVTPEFIKQWQAAGFKGSVNELTKLRNHGVTGEYGKAWKDAGYDLSVDEVIKARNHGVPAEYPRQYKAAGYSPKPEEIVTMRNHGVTPEFYSGAKKAMPELSAVEVTKLRQHGVSVEFIEGLKEAGYNFNAEEIIRLRNSGVSADYAKALAVEGKKNPDAQTLVELRNKGVSAETARKLREN